MVPHRRQQCKNQVLKTRRAIRGKAAARIRGTTAAAAARMTGMEVARSAPPPAMGPEPQNGLVMAIHQASRSSLLATGRWKAFRLRCCGACLYRTQSNELAKWNRGACSWRNRESKLLQGAMRRILLGLGCQFRFRARLLRLRRQKSKSRLALMRGPVSRWKFTAACCRWHTANSRSHQILRLCGRALPLVTCAGPQAGLSSSRAREAVWWKLLRTCTPVPGPLLGLLLRRRWCGASLSPL
mmetsp:Transcript_17462/g.40159  ORF Transcript_17462/g.40159 Transcript_17462/m.40159 type:complete len:241 (-) Transcript_17462:440-1162(-)